MNDIGSKWGTDDSELYEIETKLEQERDKMSFGKGAETFNAQMDGEKLMVGSRDFNDGSMMVGIGTEDIGSQDPDFMEMMIGEDGEIDYFTMPTGVNQYQRMYKPKPAHYGKMKTQNETNKSAGGDFIRTDGDGKHAETFDAEDDVMCGSCGDYEAVVNCDNPSCQNKLCSSCRRQHKQGNNWITIIDEENDVAFEGCDGCHREVGYVWDNTPIGKTEAGIPVRRGGWIRNAETFNGEGDFKKGMQMGAGAIVGIMGVQAVVGGVVYGLLKLMGKE